MPNESGLGAIFQAAIRGKFPTNSYLAVTNVTLQRCSMTRSYSCGLLASYYRMLA